jgi:ABC-type polysaccharide/polyol phosphate export permease
MFMTPVFWKSDRFGAHHIFLELNPFYHMLQGVRAPLLGTEVAPHTYLILTVMALVGWGVTFSIFAITRRRIVHYL